MGPWPCSLKAGLVAVLPCNDAVPDLTLGHPVLKESMNGVLQVKNMRQYPPTLPRLGQGRAAPGTTVGVERCFLAKPPSTVPLPLTCFGLPKLTDADFKTDGWPPVPISLELAFSHAAAGAMVGFMGFQN